MNTKATKIGDAPEVKEIEADASAADLRAEIATLRREFQALVDQAASAGSAAKGAATTAVKAQAAKGVEIGEHYAADVMDEWREIDRKVVTATRENPWRTLGVAALGGLIVGLIFRR